MGPETYMKALTNIKVSNLKGNYLGDKIIEDKHDLILEEL